VVTLDGAIQTAIQAAMRMENTMLVIPEGDGWQVYESPLTREQWANIGRVAITRGVYLVSPDGTLTRL
jgi:hypothetical protein